jgi:hypothetical protein
MNYSETEFNKIFLKENKYTEHVPAYIREYSKFFKLLTLFSNYINIANDYLETILSQLNLSKAHGAVLEKIAERLDIKIEKPVDVNGNYDKTLYEEMLKLAILGNGTKRNSRADRNSLSKVKDVFDSIRSIEITDYAKGKSGNPEMFLDIAITGDNDLWTTDLVDKYVIPKITGVRTILTYLLSNSLYFGFDRQDVIVVIGTINKSTEDVTIALLNAKAKELGNENIVGSTIKDATGNYWVYVGGDVQWSNEGENVIEGSAVIDTSRGYSIQGWDKGRWAQTKVFK